MNRIYSYKIAILLVIIGALNWGFTAFNLNIVDIASKKINFLFSINFPFDKVIYIIIALSAIKIFKRDTFLPFLGKTIMPASVISLKENKFNKDKITIHVKPNSKVVYWAAKKLKEDKPSVWDAYDDYSNSGVVMSNGKGVAVLKLEKGSGYLAPWKDKFIPPHVHYRYETRPGKFSRLETVYY